MTIETTKTILIQKAPSDWFSISKVLSEPDLKLTDGIKIKQALAELVNEGLFERKTEGVIIMYKRK